MSLNLTRNVRIKKTIFAKTKNKQIDGLLGHFFTHLACISSISVFWGGFCDKFCFVLLMNFPHSLRKVKLIC